MYSSGTPYSAVQKEALGRISAEVKWDILSRAFQKLWERRGLVGLVI
jgi:hypothetical protein